VSANIQRSRVKYIFRNILEHLENDVPKHESKLIYEKIGNMIHEFKFF